MAASAEAVLLTSRRGMPVIVPSLRDSDHSMPLSRHLRAGLVSTAPAGLGPQWCGASRSPGTYVPGYVLPPLRGWDRGGAERVSDIPKQIWISTEPDSYKPSHKERSSQSCFPSGAKARITSGYGRHG
jgi:hypothetical protein